MTFIWLWEYKTVIYLQRWQIISDIEILTKLMLLKKAGSLCGLRKKGFFIAIGLLGKKGYREKWGQKKIMEAMEGDWIMAMLRNV